MMRAGKRSEFTGLADTSISSCANVANLLEQSYGHCTLNAWHVQDGHMWDVGGKQNAWMVLIKFEFKEILNDHF